MLRSKSFLVPGLAAGLIGLGVAALAQPKLPTRPLPGVVDAVEVTDEMLLNPPEESWLMFRGNYASWGYSPLAQINTENVDTLQLGWSIAMEDGPNQATPLVHEGVLYLPHPDDVVTAHDATNGDLLWEYRRENDVPYWGSGHINRNIAIAGDKIFMSAHDAAIVALDKNTGELVWESSVGDPAATTHSSGPIVAGGRVFSGRLCDYSTPVGCFVAAHDAQTGQELWRTHVIPKPGEPGDESWDGLPYEDRTHASVWMVGSYDAELDLLYWGTSGPAPSPEVLRQPGKGDLLYTNSTLALDPATGEIVWYFQHLPRDNWDTDHTYERILVDAEVRPDPDETWVQNPGLPNGTQRLMTGIPGKTGTVWTLNRETGEFYWAKQTLEQNVIEAIDPATGRVTISEDAIPKQEEGAPVRVCPSLAGGRDWMAGSYSPLTKSMYMPMNNICMDMVASRDDPRYGIKPRLMVTPGEERLGRIDAINVETGRTDWRFDQQAGPMSVLATGGGLLFGGDTSRRFRAFDQESGEVLYETTLPGPVTGFPISYAVDGVQYVAVAAGGGKGGLVVWQFLSGDRSARLGGNANGLFVFRVAGSETTPDQAD
ncbi:MAG: PQQ-binding-like beta-propeller repeat protein [Pseudomonadota bacterium]